MLPAEHHGEGAERAGKAVETIKRLNELRELANGDEPYLHLVDGAVSDNLGLRGVLDIIELFEALHEAGQHTPLDHVKRIIVFIVNSTSSPATNWAHSEDPPGTLPVLVKAAGVPIDRYSGEQVDQLKDIEARWKVLRQIRDSAAFSTDKDPAVACVKNAPDAALYAIDVSSRQGRRLISSPTPDLTKARAPRVHLDLRRCCMIRTTLTAMAISAVLAGGATSAPSVTAKEPIGVSRVTPLILEKDEGERRVWRPIEGAKGWDAEPSPFILKVDRHNGGSSHLVFGTEDLPPGATIDRHRHPSADEIIFLQNGSARVSLSDKTREVHGGATVFVPANTWISVTNIGTEPIGCVFVFSAPGFDDFMRAESVPEGQKVTPLTKTEDARIMRKHAGAVIYAKP